MRGCDSVGSSLLVSTQGGYEGVGVPLYPGEFPITGPGVFVIASAPSRDWSILSVVVLCRCSVVSSIGVFWECRMACGI